MSVDPSKVEKRELRVTLDRATPAVAFELKRGVRHPELRGRVANMSRRGMFIESDTLLASSKDLTLESSVQFALRIDRDSEDVTGVGTVRWVRTQALGPYSPRGVGVQVIEFHEHAERRYLEFLETRLQGLGVTDLMDPDFVGVSPTMRTDEVLSIMRSAGAGCALILDAKGAALGLFSADELLAASSVPAYDQDPIARHMRREPIALTTDHPTEEAYSLMRHGAAHHMPVLEDGIVVGVLSTRELIRHWSEFMELQSRRLTRNYDRAVGVIAHDLRTPIGLIQTTTQMVTSGEMSPVEYVRSGLPEIVESSCDMMMNLIDDILDVGRIRSGAVKLECRPVELGDLLARVARAFGPAAQAKRIELSFSMMGTLPKIKADPLRLQQVLNNLVGNALKFTPEGGKIGIGARLAHSRVAVWVVDTGAGVPAHEIGDLFRDYARASTRPSGSEKSTGLGLAICKRLVEAHGGAIELDSEVGIGTTVTVTLPIGDIQ